MKTPSLISSCVICLGLAFLAPGLTACSTVPKAEEQDAFRADAEAAVLWFEDNVVGLRAQINQSAGYAVFPSVGQFGLFIAGGKYGRGTLNTPDGAQLGWAAISTGSLGLQAGVQGFKMLVVFEDERTLDAFQRDDLEGSASAVAVAGDAGGSVAAPFQHGVAVYQGANSGLMAGVNVGLNYMRYKPLAR